MKFLGFCEVLQSFTLLAYLVSFAAHCKNNCENNAELLSKFKCSEDFCDNIICEDVECKYGHIVRKSESYCHCCDVCVKSLGENEDCEEEVHDSLRDIGASRCKEGLKCVKGKCILDEAVPFGSSCLHLANILKSKRGTGNFSEELWFPTCDSSGNYKPTQQKNRKSTCVDENGQKLFGSGDNKLENSCACSRHMKKRQNKNLSLYNIKPQEHCSQTGSFEPLQCINDLCYCADEETGEVTSRMVKREYLDKLPCYTSESDEEYLKSCEMKLQRSRKAAYDFHLKGIQLHGADIVKCDPDGTFSPTQCEPDRCHCTDKDGVSTKYGLEIKDIEEGKITMICNCARDEAPGTVFRCEGHGNYALLQCFNTKKCVCVDSDGDTISKSSEGIKEDFCKNLLQNLLRETSDDDDSQQSIPPITTETDYEYDDNNMFTFA